MRTIFTLVLLALSAGVFAQRNCGAMEYLQMQMENDPKRSVKLEAIERHTEDIESSGIRAVNGVITIPVVVHVVYNTTAENISTAQILSQIEVLNEDFRRQNTDQNNIWSQAADSEIAFCMATVDPSGAPTTGITRTSTSVTAFGTNDQVKFASSGGKMLGHQINTSTFGCATSVEVSWVMLSSQAAMLLQMALFVITNISELQELPLPPLILVAPAPTKSVTGLIFATSGVMATAASTISLPIHQPPTHQTMAVRLVTYHAIPLTWFKITWTIQTMHV